jgi:predicted ribosome quality control (RQC) complex YloA/Tae2 family protein
MAVGLDSFGITFLVRELGELLRGRVLKRVALVGDRVLTIDFKGKGARRLTFLAQPSLPLLCVREPDSPPRHSHKIALELPPMPRFEEPLAGSTVKDISQIELERVVLMTVEGRGTLHRLYFELIPPFPNLYLTDERDTILAVLFRAGTRTRHRVQEKGKTYLPPVVQNKIHPAEVTARDLEAMDCPRQPEVLSRRVLGIGPLLSREVVARSSGSGSIQRALGDVISDYREGRSIPHLSTVASSVVKNPPHLAITWYRPSIAEAESIERIDSLNTGVCTVIDAFLTTSKLEMMKVSVRRHLAREIRKARKALTRTGIAEEHEQDSATYRRYGETILANLGRIEKGVHSARLPDIHSPAGEMIRIPLEPRMSPQANADVYFAKARKSARRAELAKRNLDEMQARLDDLITLEQRASASGLTETKLAEIAEALARPRVAGKAKKQPIDEKAERLGIRPRRFEVTGGWTVLVGRSARENDILSHKYASPGDLWFHARQAQGSHVVLRRGRKKTQVTKQAILEAAAIAAHYSKARTSKHVAVSYTEKRYVKKVRKGAAGTAAMLREKVVFVNPAVP